MRRSLARLVLTAGFAGALTLVATAGTQAASRSGVIFLPDGFSPEGVATGAGNSVYVGSLADGDIWRGDLRTGQGEILADAPKGRIAVGLKVSQRTRQVFVAGGGAGQAYVYDARSGADLGAITLTSGPSFVNDVALTSGGAWFTDSLQPQLYFLPVAPDGSLGSVRTLPLTGPAAEIVAPFNLNGIAASPDGSKLVVAHSGLAALMAVDPVSGQSQTIDLGGASVPNADGILLDGPRLWVVQNFVNQVSEIRMAPDYRSGTVESVRTDPDFRIPTTIARQGNTLVAVNARFDLGIPGPADAEYQLVLFDR